MSGWRGSTSRRRKPTCAPGCRRSVRTGGGRRGWRRSAALAARAHGNIKGGSAVIEQALEGMLLGDHHPVLIRMHMDHITVLDRLAAEIEEQIEAALDAIPAAWGVTADGVPSPGPGRMPRYCPRRNGSRRSPASASSSPERSSPRQAWI